MAHLLQVTGIAQETDFSSAPKEIRNLLVLNNGELRVSVSESDVKKVLEYMLEVGPYSHPKINSPTVSSIEPDTTDDSEDEEDEDTNEESDDGVPSL